jgi:hypothetical protein
MAGIKWVVDAIGKSGTGYGAGLMQIDSQHHARLSEFGIKPEHLLTDACLNIYTGAYYLALAFRSGASAGRQSVPTTRDSAERTGDATTGICRRLKLSTGPSRQIKTRDNPGC